MGYITTHYLSQGTVSEGGDASGSWTNFAINEFELHDDFVPGLEFGTYSYDG